MIRNRENIIDLIYHSMKDCATSCDDESMTILAADIEKNIYNNAIEYCTIKCGVATVGNTYFVGNYSDTGYRVIYNMGENIISAIMNNVLSIDELCTKTSQELNPQIFDKYIKEIEIRNNQKIVKKVSHLETCRRCKKKETTIIEYTGAALDEMGKLSIQCIHCKLTWRK